MGKLETDGTHSGLQRECRISIRAYSILRSTHLTGNTSRDDNDLDALQGLVELVRRVANNLFQRVRDEA